MELSIQQVTEENREEILNLKVSLEQRDFIETVEQCLKEAKRLELWRPVGIYNHNIPVGFAMYGKFPEEGEHGRVWLDRFLIDQNYQGRGFGKNALALLLERLEKEYSCEEIFLSLYDKNTLAKELYLKFGFRFNGELDWNGEKVMVRKKGSSLEY